MGKGGERDNNYFFKKGVLTAGLSFSFLSLFFFFFFFKERSWLLRISVSQGEQGMLWTVGGRFSRG